eukprot:4776890-Pyramimonas_sp.AAC.1
MRRTLSPALPLGTARAAMTCSLIKRSKRECTGGAAPNRSVDDANVDGRGGSWVGASPGAECHARRYSRPFTPVGGVVNSGPEAVNSGPEGGNSGTEG